MIFLDKNDIMSQAEKYRQEMMRLYGKSTSRMENTVQTTPIQSQNTNPSQPIEDTPEPTIQDIPELIENEQDMLINEPEIEEDTATIEETEIMPIEQDLSFQGDIDERYPDPVLDELRNNRNIEYTDEAYVKQNGYDSVGWISVDVRTGESSNPVSGASVIISSIDDGKLRFKANAVTNESGQVFKIPLPVPSATLSMDSENRIRPYATYDVSVYASGFFRTRSVDVPVFAGITSMQLFNLVPLPLHMKENDETITYYNQEPELN